MGPVAARAGVTRALVYKHFANKDDLLAGPLPARGTPASTGRSAPVSTAAPEGFEPKLRAFIGASLDAVEEHAPFFTPLRATGADDAFRQGRRSRDRGTVGYFAALAAARLRPRPPHGPRRSSPCCSRASARCSPRCARGRAPTQHQFLLDTYVEMTLGALHRLAAPPPPP